MKDGLRRGNSHDAITREVGPHSPRGIHKEHSLLFMEFSLINRLIFDQQHLLRTASAAAPNTEAGAALELSFSSAAPRA